MKHLLFTVHDVKAEIFLPPFFVPTLGIAKRAFADAINSEEHQFAKHPHDYTLFLIGEYEDLDATISIGDKKSLGNGVEYLSADLANTNEDLFDGPPDAPILPDQTG